MKVFLAVLLLVATNVWSGPSMPRLIMPRITTPTPRVTPPPSPVRPTPTPSPVRSFSYNNRNYTPVYQNNILLWVIWFSVINGQQVEQRADCANPLNEHDRKICETAKTQQ